MNNKRMLLNSDFKYLLVALQAAVIKPMQPWFATMETTHRVSISMVLPMACLVIKVTDPSYPITTTDYSDPAHPVKEVINVSVLLHGLNVYVCTASNF